MKKLFALISFVFVCITANAGPLHEEFKLDIAVYLAAQEKTPDNIIKYSDEQGALAKAVLNPARIQSMLAETLADVDGGKQLKTVLESYKPVMKNYETIFRKQKGNYDAEYLDSFETFYQLITGGIKPLNAIKTEEIKDEAMKTMMEALVKVATTLPTLILKTLEKSIQDGQFSASFVPVAETRLAKLRAETIK